MTKPAIIFDLDGTLVDTAPDLINTLNHILEQENHPPAPEPLMRTMISEGARAMLVKGFELAGEQKSAEQFDELTRRFIAHYADNIVHSSRPFEGVIKALDRLASNGHAMAICTNKTERLAKKLIESLAMDDYFRAIIGADTLEVKKPHPGHIWGTIEAIGASRDHAVMIGDSETDIRAAQAANIPVIAVNFGYSIEPVESFNPDAVLSTYDDLPAALASFFREA
jgi:phosphoglycolate phosphatase